MRDPLLTIDNMYRSLKPGGVLLAHCPNYTVPLEVHFNILLVTRSKTINGWLYRSKIQKYPSVWDELNFIRYIAVRKHLSGAAGASPSTRPRCRFWSGRLLDDPIFAQRMPMPVGAFGAILHYTGLIHALGLIPVRLQTPMEVLIRKTLIAPSSKPQLPNSVEL